MKNEAVTLSLLAMIMTAMTDASAWSITVQPGPVEVKHGSSVILWCQLKQDTEKVAPVLWQSPPNFQTRSTNCVSFDREKYGISCGEIPLWYNMTIKDVQWADRGKYRCIDVYSSGIVDLKVLVPVRDVSLTYVSNSTSKPLPPVLSKGVDAVLNCSTDCAYPAPQISWFENGQPFKDSATVTELGCSGEKEGQKRTISTISVRGKYVENERKESVISCEGRNVFGEKNIFKAIVVTYDADPCESVRCPPGRVCQATSQNRGVCVCGPPDLCNDHHKQVCGDDGNMYPSHCELHRTACIKDKHIGVDHTDIKCIHIVTTSPPQIIIGDIVTAVVVPVVFIPIVVISTFFLVRRRPKEVLKPRHKLEEGDVRSAPPLGTSETTETKPQPVVVADILDVRCGSGDSEHINTESQ